MSEYRIRNRQGELLQDFDANGKKEAIAIAEEARDARITSILYQNSGSGSEEPIWVMPGPSDFRAQGRVGLCDEDEDG